MPGVTSLWQVTHSFLMVHFSSTGNPDLTHSLKPPLRQYIFEYPIFLSFHATRALVDSVGRAQYWLNQAVCEEFYGRVEYR